MAKKKVKLVEANEPIPEKVVVQPVTEEPKAEPDSSLAATIAYLVSGNPARNKVESRLLFEWNHLTKWQRYALAYEWNLPYTPQARHDRLAKEAKERLGNIG